MSTITLTRRIFLTGPVAGIIPAALTSVALRGDEKSSQFLEGWDRGKLSPAITEQTLQEFIQTHARIAGRQNKILAGDLRAVCASMGTYVSHCQEIGLNSALEQHARNNGDQLLSYQPREEDLLGVQQVLADRGMRVSMDRLRSTFSPSEQDRRNGLAQLERYGIYGTCDRAIQKLTRMADDLERVGGSLGGPSVVQVSLMGDSADLTCDALVLLATMYGIGCLFGVFIFCITAAVLFLFEAFLELIDFCD